MNLAPGLLRLPSLLVFAQMLTLLPLICFGQNPGPGQLYDDTRIPRVDIVIDEDLLEMILDSNNLEDNTEHPSTFIFSTEEFSDTLENVGFRLRGNTSRNAEKKSFKISINSFEKGRDYRGVEKINLNGEQNDPSLMRSKIFWDVYRDAGLIASRSNHVEFYINGEFRGLYANVEHIDEEFIQKRYLDGSGNLYKCLWPADLTYRGADPEAYKRPEPWGRQAYELKTNRQEDDYSDLAHFISVVHNTPVSMLECELEKVLEVDDCLKVYALDILFGHWDGPVYNKNNFYLYHDPSTGKFTLIPFDLDNTLGIDWIRTGWEEQNVYEWVWNRDSRPLYEKLMLVPQYRQKFTYYLDFFLEKYFDSGWIHDRVDALRPLAQGPRNRDDYAELDYGWTFVDYLQSFDQGLGGHVAYGLLEFVEDRRSQIARWFEPHRIWPNIINESLESTGGRLTFTIDTENPDDITEATFNWRIDGGPWQEEEMMRVGDQRSFSIDLGFAECMDYYYTLTYTAHRSRNFPYCEYKTIKGEDFDLVSLVINEFMASNDTYQADEEGEYDDWIEIYNRGNEAVSLNDYFLTDKKNNRVKWQLPDVVLEPDSYYVVWADEDGEQGDHHANFKLSAGGEYIGLYTLVDQFPALVDEVEFGEQESDVSYARLPNGTGDFSFDDTPSLGENNGSASSTDNLASSKVKVFPNPTSDWIRLEVEGNESILRISMFSQTGQMVLDDRSPSGKVDLTDLPTGTYLTRIEHASGVEVQKVLKR